MRTDGPGPQRAAARRTAQIVQFSPSMGELCGVAVFADNMAAALRAAGIGVRTQARVSHPAGADLLLVQYHDELVGHGELVSLIRRAHQPAVLMAHSAGLAAGDLGAAGVMAMTDAMLAPGPELPTLIFPHPALVPEASCDRSALRQRLGLSSDRRIVATCGFLRFERDLPGILSRLLPGASALGWLVLLVTSPWRLPSPGLLGEIRAIGDRYPGSFRHLHEHLPEPELTGYLRASDLLWCWTRAQGAAYASGVISQMYASGTRVVAADRPAHEHVLRLPNTVRAPATIDRFVAELLRQMASGCTATHDPAPVSWARTASQVAGFLSQFIDRR